MTHGKKTCDYVRTDEIAEDFVTELRVEWARTGEMSLDKHAALCQTK